MNPSNNPIFPKDKKPNNIWGKVVINDWTTLPIESSEYFCFLLNHSWRILMKLRIKTEKGNNIYHCSGMPMRIFISQNFIKRNNKNSVDVKIVTKKIMPETKLIALRSSVGWMIASSYPNVDIFANTIV